MMDVPGYEELVKIYEEAYDQMARGKGKERHATDEPWHKQPIIRRGRMFRGGCLFQATKKIEEIERLDTKEKILEELYGAMNHIAAEIYIIKNKPEPPIILDPGDLKSITEEMRVEAPSRITFVGGQAEMKIR